jgi:hypothetical protein
MVQLCFQSAQLFFVNDVFVRFHEGVIVSMHIASIASLCYHGVQNMAELTVRLVYSPPT